MASSDAIQHQPRSFDGHAAGFPACWASAFVSALERAELRDVVEQLDETLCRQRSDLVFGGAIGDGDAATALLEPNAAHAKHSLALGGDHVQARFADVDLLLADGGNGDAGLVPLAASPR